jgi:hypothetical protein
MISNLKVVNYKFYNFSRSTIFILGVFPFKVVWKIRILNFWNSNVVLHDKMNSNEKFSNYKILYLLKIYKVYFCCLVICSSEIVVLILFTNLIYLSCSFMKLMRDVDFMNNVTIALSNEEMTKIKFVDLKKLYKFVVENFFIWINLLLQNMHWNLSLPSAKKNTWQRPSLSSLKKTLGKDLLCLV